MNKIVAHLVLLFIASRVYKYNHTHIAGRVYISRKQLSEYNTKTPPSKRHSCPRVNSVMCTKPGLEDRITSGLGPRAAEDVQLAKGDSTGGTAATANEILRETKKGSHPHERFLWKRNSAHPQALASTRQGRVEYTPPPRVGGVGSVSTIAAGIPIRAAGWGPVAQYVKPVVVWWGSMTLAVQTMFPNVVVTQT